MNKRDDNVIYVRQVANERVRKEGHTWEAFAKFEGSSVIARAMSKEGAILRAQEFLDIVNNGDKQVYEVRFEM